MTGEPIGKFLYPERTKLKEGASLSLSEIMESLDQRFDLFLQRIIKEEQYEPRKEEFTILAELIKKTPLSYILIKAYGNELDFSSKNKLDGDTIRQLLLNTFLFHYTYKLVPEPEDTAQADKTQPLQYMGKKIFEDERVTLPMMYAIEHFFVDFADQLFEYVENKAPPTQDINNTLDCLTSFSDFSLLSKENVNLLLRAFHNAIESIESESELRLFLRSLVKITEDEEHKLTMALMKEFENIFEIFAREAWIRAKVESQTQTTTTSSPAI